VNGAPHPLAPWLSVVTPEAGRDLVALARAARDEIRDRCLGRGGLLFRGFDPLGAEGFGAFCAALSGELLDYTERSTPRTRVEGNVFTSTEYPPEAHIPLHGEMSYASRWPRVLWFHAEVVAAEGGETPLADARAVHALVPPEVRARFEERGGVTYVRNFHRLLDQPWQVVYGVETRDELEALLRRRGIAFAWLPGEVLRTSAMGQAALAHPLTGERVWFNQAHLFHVSSLPARVAQTLLARFGAQGVPRTACYGDGSPIEPDALAAIRDAYARAEVVVPWEPGDVLMLDNMLISHGRRPYRGARRTLVAMAEAYPPNP